MKNKTISKIICRIFGHYMHSPWRSSNYKTNYCLRCGYKNDEYKIEGYISRK